MVKLDDEEAGWLPFLKSGELQKRNNMNTPIVKKEFKWGFTACNGPLLALYTAGYFAYIAFGGVLFLAIEGYEDVDLLRKIGLAKEITIKKFPNVTGAALDDFVSEIASMGINGLQGYNSSESKWTYSQAVFFCVTVLTTIGYGHVAPVSQAGKGICMLYSGFGIPFTLLLLAAYVNRLMSVAFKLQKILTSKLNEVLKPIVIRFIFLTTITVTICTLFVFLPALLFSYLEEGWTYLDALYFCFISLTTVGLGDLVPTKNLKLQHRGIYRFGVTVYLLLGVLSIMFLMALISQFHECILCRKSTSKKPSNSGKFSSYGALISESDLLFQESIKSNNQDISLP